MKGKMLYLGVMISLFYSTAAFQVKGQGMISGRVMESETSGAAFASVTILNVSDSVMVKGAITDEDGNYSLRQVPEGRYLIAISSVGFEKVYLDPIDYESSQSLVLPEIRLHEASLALGEVVVTAQRPMIERKADRYVMDMEATPFQTNNLSEILLATPFVQSKGGGISINGRTGILVLVDNVPVPSATLESLFESMSGDEIEKIEFITNVSSQYDANVNGVISITTKKAKSMGFTGSVRGNYSQGVKGKFRGGGNLTYRKNNLTAYANINMFRGINYNESTTLRYLNIEGNDLLFNESEVINYRVSWPSIRTGLNYSLGDNHSIGMQVSLVGPQTFPSLSQSETAFSNPLGTTIDSILVKPIMIEYDGTVKSYSLNYEGKLDTLGKTVEMIMTYSTVANIRIFSMLYQDIFNPQGERIRRLDVIKNNNLGWSKNWIGQVDFQLPYQNKIRFDAGLKYSRSRAHSDISQEIQENGSFVLVPEFSFLNRLSEDIYAGYFKGGKSWDSFSLNAGVRMEQTNMEGNDAEVNRRFFNIFPSLNLEKKFANELSSSLYYRRTIKRPGFNSLMPFRFVIDDYTQNVGNPALQPVMMDNIAMSLLKSSNLFVELSYTHNQNDFTTLPVQEGTVTVFQERNFNSQVYQLSSNYSHEFFKWWTCAFYGYVNFTQAASNFTEQNFSLEGYGSSVSFTNTFTLPRDLSLQVYYNYDGPSVYGLMKFGAMNYSRVSLKGNLLDKRVQYTLGVADIFRGTVYRADINSLNILTSYAGYEDTRRVDFGLVYNFGKRTVKSAPTKDLGNEDVLNRAN